MIDLSQQREHDRIRARWPAGKRVVYMWWDARSREHRDYAAVVTGFCVIVRAGRAQPRVTVKLEGFPRTRNVGVLSLRDHGPFNVRGLG